MSLPTEPLHALAEKNFTENLRTLLEAKGHTQGTLATALTDADLKWTQTTVSRVLSGTRGVSLGEAVAIARTLDTPLELMLQADGGASLRAAILQATERVETTASALRGAAQALAEAQAELRSLLAHEGAEDLLTERETIRAREALATQEAV